MTAARSAREAAAGAIGAVTPPPVALWSGHVAGKTYLGTSEPAPRETQNTVQDIGSDLGLEREFYISNGDGVAEDAFIDAAYLRNRISWISWKASQTPATILADWDSINAGTQDTAITARANRYKATLKPVIITWNSQPDRDGTTDAHGLAFRTAWKRIASRFATAGATNVAFVPLVSDDLWNGGTVSRWIDAEMVGTCAFIGVRSEKTVANGTFATRLPAVLTWLDGLGYPTKMLGVGISSGYTSPGQTGADWWNASWAWVEANISRVGAVAYHNNNNSPPPSGTWLLSEGPAKLAAFGASASSPLATMLGQDATGQVPGAAVVTAGTVTASSIAITWTASSAPADSPVQTYEIWRQLGVGTPVNVTDLAATARAYTFTGLASGSSYTVWVRALNRWGAGAASNKPTLVTTGGVVPTAPGQPAVSAITDTSATLSWTAASSPASVITAYKIYDGLTLLKTVGDVLTTGLTGLTSGADYSVTVTATNSSGEGADSPARIFVTTGVSSNTLIAYVAGDIAHPTFIEGAQLTSNLIVSRTDKDFVLTVGDNAYYDGTLSQYQLNYGPTWGRFKSITYPTPGNHDRPPIYDGYKGYWGAKATPDGTRIYYSFVQGTWLFMAMDSADSEDGGTGAGIEAAQTTWADNVLTNRPSGVTGICAFWHHPRFSSGGHGNHTNVGTMVSLLHQHKADLILTGHDHHYERFGQLNAAGTAYDTVNGIRHFVLGTGGDGGRAMGATKFGSQKIIQGSPAARGVTRFVFTPTSYSWEFIAVGSTTGTDTGTTAVHPK